VLETQLQFARIPATAFSLRGYPEAAITMRSRGMNDLLLGALFPRHGRTLDLARAADWFEQLLEGVNSAEIGALDNVLQSCLASDRNLRYPTVDDMQRALIPAIRQCSPFAPSPSAEAASTAVL
jgi:hypothetical protein